ncbi:MAG: neutral/alkaline non-lysosomal ceramidase N-terminal domain-containing protein [Planctomycetes bacterium]|nr:neutral/alkaline non-lysosomal ceramidase N-terminal domain-containing protein [Planctomycetota bacterium]
MKWFGAFTAALFVLAGTAGAESTDDRRDWKAAAGAVAITPTEPVWMAGYAARDKPSEGAIHDLFAKALIMEDAAGNRLVIITVDLIGITPELRGGVEAAVSKLGIPAQSLLMNASHTHCGPELRGDRLVRFGIDGKYAAMSHQYVRQTAAKIGRMVADTLKQLQPSRLVFSRARTGFAMNRRLPTDSGYINSPNPDGPVDHEVPVLQVLGADETLTAVLFGYACHATTLSFQQLCGDYPGFAQQYIEESHPGTVALFLNGCSADQNPYPRRTLELAQQHGRALANGVETALETKSKREIHGPLRVAIDYATLKFAGPPSRQEVEAEAASSNKYERFHGQALLEQLQQHGKIETEYSSFPIQAAQFGSDLTLVAICGEVVVDYSLRLKRELAGDDAPIIWVAGYSNYVFGYLPSLRVLKEGGYEGGGAMRYTVFPGPFEESVEDRVIDKVNELVTIVRERR